MHTPLQANRLVRWLAVTALGLLAAPAAQAQLAGPKAIPGDYQTVAEAITALNAAGVGAGGVTFNIAPGYTETFASPTAGAITATGTAANPIVFQKASPGANPKITAGVGTTTNLDAIISLAGSDYVTLDGLELVENAANTTATTQMEFGIAMFRPSPTDGCQNNTIRNCVVTLNKANTATFGIYGAASTAAASTAVAATSPAGANSNNRIYSNTVSNAVSGMYLTAASATTTANYDLNNEIGVLGGNTVTNFGGAGTSGWGIGVNMQNGAKIANNTVNSNGGTAGTSTLRGIYGNTGTSSNFDVTNNIVTLAGGATTSSVIGIDNGIGSTASSNTVNITGNTIQNSTYTTATSGAFYGIQNTASAAVVNLNGNTITGNASSATSGNFMAVRNTASAPTLNMNNNIVTNNTLTGSGEFNVLYNSGTTSVALNANNNQMSNTAALATTGSVYFLQNSISNTGVVNMLNNTFGSFTKSGAGGTVYGYYNNSGPTATQTISGNTISGIGLTGATGFYGLYINTSTSQTSTLTNNTVSNIVGGTSAAYGMYLGYGTATSTVNGNTISAIAGGGTVYGLNLGGSLAGGTIYSNTIHTLSSTGASTVYGLYTAATNPTIYRNKIYNLFGTDAGTAVNGIYVNSGTTVTLHNNLVGDLRATAATGLVAVNGINVSGSTTANVYYNTVYVSATSTGATFGTSGLYLNSSSTSLDLRNNIIINKSTAAGTGGYTAALRRVSGTAGTAPANLASTTNNNLYYAGTPSATNVIYVEGSATATNVMQTLGDYKSFVAPRESASQTEDTPFLSTVGSSANFLHINPAVATFAEGKGQPISAITIDFDNDTRSTTTPDIGADEGTFLQAGSAVDVAAGGLISPSATGCYGASESVVVGVRNNGTQAINFASNPATVTVNVSGAATQTFTATVNTGTLAPGAVQNVTVGTLNMSAAGTYSFALTVNAQGDGDATNNTGSATRTKVAVVTGPQTLNFTGFTGTNLSTLYPGWYEATGVTLPTGTTSAWTNDDYANVVSGPNGISAKINLYTTGKNDWMVSPRVLATSTSVLTYDLALTAFAATTTATLGSDDRLEVRVSTDCGLTFTTIKSYTASTPISNTGQTETISLASYAGQEIIVAFFATEGTVDDAPDNDLFIDNISLNPQAVDLAPTALVSPASGQGCYSAAETVVATIRNAGAQPLDFSVNPASVTVNVTGATTQTLTATVTSGTLAPGASQNVTLGQTLNMSTVGTYTFGITATVTGDQNTANDVLATSPTRTVVAPVAGTLSPGSGSLCVSGTATLTLAGSANGSIQYQSSTDNVTFTDIAGATSATYTTPVLNATTYFRARTVCNGNVATSNTATISVTNPQVTTTNSPVAICAGSTATLTATPATGSTVRFFETATGGTALASTGNSFTTPALTASRQYYVEAVSGNTETAGKATTPGSDGGYSGGNTGVAFTATSPVIIQSVTVFPSSTTAGNMSVELRSSTGTVISSAGPFAVPAGSSTVRTPLVLPVNLSVPSAGSYRLVTATSPSPPELYRDFTNSFPYNSPSGAVSVTGGILTGSTSGSYYFFYNWQISTDCAGTRTAIQVNVTDAPTATLAATGTACTNSPFALNGSVGGTATGGTYTTSGTGTFSPNATTLNATYLPSAADATAGTVTITLTTAGPAVCSAATAQSTLTITTPADASFSYPTSNTYCAGSTSTVAPTLGTGAVAGTFSSTTGLTIDATTGVITLASSAPGTYTVTNTVAASGACGAVSATSTVTIVPATSAAFSYGGSTFCLSGSNPTATVTGTTGGTFSSTSGLTINATTGAITLASSTAGTYVVTYSVGGSCPSSSTQTVTITTAPSATFSYGTTPTYCVSGATNPAPSFGTGASGGVFSSTTGLTINPTTGVITLSSSTPGTYTVTNTIAASSGCAASTATATVTITAAPVASFSYGATSTYCVSGTANPAVVLGTGAVAGTFTSTTGLTLNATTGAITLASSTPGTYTVTNTVAAAGGCAAATATATVTILPRPAAPVLTATYNGATNTTTLASSAATGNQFYLNGTLLAGATAQTYTVSGTPAQLGSYTVTTTNASGCTSPPSAPVVITGARNGIAGTSLRLYPNPTPSGEVTLELTGYRLATQLTVLDAMGRVVAREVLPAAAGTAIHTLNLKDVATGVYMLRLSNADGVETRRLVRE